MTPELKEKLESLSRYLSDSEGIDDHVRQSLIDSLQGIESALASEDEEDRHDGPLDNLKGAFAGLESHHPHAAEIIRDVTNILSRMGI